MKEPKLWKKLDEYEGRMFGHIVFGVILLTFLFVMSFVVLPFMSYNP